MRRRSSKSVVKYFSLTGEVQLILEDLSTDEVGGMDGVAVKCLDIVQNTDSEGSLLRSNRR